MTASRDAGDPIRTRSRGDARVGSAAARRPVRPGLLAGAGLAGADAWRAWAAAGGR